VIRKAIFEQAGGFDADNLKVAFNDVDFCLRVRQSGFENVWTPFAELYHLESISRGPEDNPRKIARFHGEVKHMQNKWRLEPDPYYSPNLTLEREDFSLSSTRPRV
jgi:GT2 family glycosyltransferase